jgi:hypothetical protein
MNWIDIDKNIISMMGIYNDKEKLYADIKKLYNWNDSQVEHAVGPLLIRWNWYNKTTDIPVKKKRTIKTKKVKK